jgi:lipid-binding SYLF domain-containing protein
MLHTGLRQKNNVSMKHLIWERESNMKRFTSVICLALLAGSSAAYAASTKSDLTERLTKAQAVLQEIEDTPDKGIPSKITQSATCIGVFPSVLKAAFIVGGNYGQGVVTCRTDHGWSAPVFIRIAGGSFGFQIGGQSTDLVLVAMNQKGFQDLLQSKFKIGGSASAAAGPVGRDAGASTNWKMDSELLTYSRAKGLFAVIDLNGAVVDQNVDDTRTFYDGADYSFDKILHGGVPVPADAAPFVRTASKYFMNSQM